MHEAMIVHQENSKIKKKVVLIFSMSLFSLVEIDPLVFLKDFMAHLVVIYLMKSFNFN